MSQSPEKQKLGDLGESLVAKHCPCAKCKRENTLKLLPKNFKCADVVCEVPSGAVVRLK